MMWRTQQGDPLFVMSNKSRVMLCRREISLDMKKETIVVIYPVNIIDIGHLTRFYLYKSQLYLYIYISYIYNYV